jgi:hypothetical protein
MTAKKPKCRVNWCKPYRAGTICNYADEVTNECTQTDKYRCPCGEIVRVPTLGRSLMQTEEQIRARLAEMEEKFKELNEKWDREEAGKLYSDEAGMDSEDYDAHDRLKFAIAEFKKILGVGDE